MSAADAERPDHRPAGSADHAARDAEPPRSPVPAGGTPAPGGDRPVRTDWPSLDAVTTRREPAAVADPPSAGSGDPTDASPRPTDPATPDPDDPAPTADRTETGKRTRHGDHPEVGDPPGSGDRPVSGDREQAAVPAEGSVGAEAGEPAEGTVRAGAGNRAVGVGAGHAGTRVGPDDPVDVEAVALVEPVVEASSGADFPLWPRAEAPAAPVAVRPEPPRPVPYRRPRRAAVGLPLLVLLALATAFLAWVGAEPLWLAVGHADRGTLAVTDCVGGGINERCTGDFTAAGHRYRVHGVAVTGTPDGRRAGARLAAEMVGPDGRTAYAGDRFGLTLRWAVPLGLVVLLGFLGVLATGAGRLRGTHRAAATLLGLACPLVLSAGVLATVW